MSSYSFLHSMYKFPTKVVDNIHNDNELIDVIRNQFASIYAKNFIDFSELSQKDWANILPVSMRTLQRDFCDEKKVLDFKVSEAILEIGEIYSIGLEAFDGNKGRLKDWLFTENAYFNSKRPIDIMDSHKGRDMVKAELNRIEYSEFS